MEPRCASGVCLELAITAIFQLFGLRRLQTRKQQARVGKLKHVDLVFEIVACTIDRGCTVDSVPITSLSPVRLCNLHPLPLCTSKSYGKPPPESKKRILATNAMSQVDAVDQRGRKSLLIADGARCYAPLGRMYKMMVRQCNHSKGIFSINRRIRGRGWVKIHTGGIDSCWTILKAGVPDKIASKCGSKQNPLLWKYIRSAQWRWEMNSADLLAKTGLYLAKL